MEKGKRKFGLAGRLETYQKKILGLFSAIMKKNGKSYGRLQASALGCDFFALIHQYTNTQKRVFLLCEGFFPSRLSFVCLCCQKSDLSGPIHGYAYKMTTFLFVYLFFLFVA